MKTSQEKLTELRETWQPKALEAVAEQIPMGMGGMLVSVMEPMADQWCNDLLAKSPDELDAIIANICDGLGKQRSDGSAAIIITPGGAFYVLDGDALDSTRTTPVRSGADSVGEVDTGENAVPVGGSAAADS